MYNIYIYIVIYRLIISLYHIGVVRLKLGSKKKCPKTFVSSENIFC